MILAHLPQRDPQPQKLVQDIDAGARPFDEYVDDHSESSSFYDKWV